MYLEHFGISEHPFTLTPNTQFYCNLTAHENALNVLLFSLEGDEGFIKITGEVGTGKTLLCRKLLNMLDSPYVTAYVPSPDLSPGELRKAFAKELHIEIDGLDETKLRDRLVAKLLEHHSKGEKVVLIIDEAQALPDDTLETMRLLTNLETESKRLLQIVLFAQPELDERLAQRKFRQLQQRITFSYQLGTLSIEDVKSYIFHRLAIAGYRSGNLFNKAALDLVIKSCSGTPRLINIVCNKAMLVAYGKGDKKIGKKAIRSALQDSNTHVKQAISRNNKQLLFGCLMAALLSVVGYAAYLHYEGLI